MHEDGQKLLRTVFGRFRVLVNTVSDPLNHLHVVVDVLDEPLGRFHVTINMMRNLQVSGHRHLALFFRKYVQSRKRILNIRPSNQPLQKFFCSIMS